MKLETKNFVEFVDYLKAENILESHEVNEALSFVGGMEGVISDEFYIFGYEGLGRYISGKLSLDELKEFALQNFEILAQQVDGRYFFVQSLLDIPKLSKIERISLIELMPKDYQHFLFMRFIGLDYQQ